MLKNLERFNESELNLIYKAYLYASKYHEGQVRKSKEAYIIHPLAVAQILIDIGMDAEAVSAGLLHDTLEDTALSKNELVKEFGWTIANLVEGVTKISNISHMKKEDLELATIRKVIMYFYDDIRVIIIKLADRLHNMRTLEYMPYEKQISKSQETLNFYVPIANKIGAQRILEELADISFSYLEPQKYEMIKEQRQELFEIQSGVLKDSIEKIHLDLLTRDIPNYLKLKIKSIYKIYKQLEYDKLSLLSMDDLVILKIVVDQVYDCYTALGVVNREFRAKKVIDYISNPMPNGYQSLESIVFSPNENCSFVNVRIRDKKMEQVATYGITPKMYKENQSYRKNLFHFIASINEDAKNNEDFIHRIMMEGFNKNIYIYTSRGEIRELPAGSSIIDFAYSLHSDIGEHLVGAIVNDEYVMPTYVLKNYDRVEVIFDKNRTTFDSSWENYVVTTNAKRRIRKAKNKK